MLALASRRPSASSLAAGRPSASWFAMMAGDSVGRAGRTCRAGRKMPTSALIHGIGTRMLCDFGGRSSGDAISPLFGAPSVVGRGHVESWDAPLSIVGRS
eukprot:scaffold191378_cov28-Tisochrysis_lutea.AAC.6